MARNRDVLEEAESAERASIAAGAIYSERFISAKEDAWAEKAKLDEATTRLKAASGNKSAIGEYVKSFADLIVCINTTEIKSLSLGFHR